MTATTVVKLVIAIANVYLAYKYISTIDFAYWQTMIGLWVVYSTIDALEVRSKIDRLERTLRKEII